VFYSLRVEEGYWWLPVLRLGKECLGTPALRGGEFRRNGFCAGTARGHDGASGREGGEDSGGSSEAEIRAGIHEPDRQDSGVSSVAEQLDQILEIELGMVQRRVFETMKGRFLFRVKSAAQDFLLREGTDMKHGARHLKRAIERHLVYPLASLLAIEQVSLGDVLSIDWDGGDARLRFSDLPSKWIVSAAWGTLSVRSCDRQLRYRQSSSCARRPTRISCLSATVQVERLPMPLSQVQPEDCRHRAPGSLTLY
jgi:hypothetical protein